MAQNVKTAVGVVIASVKTVNDLAIASVKTIAGVDNTSGGGGGIVNNIFTDDFNRSNEAPLTTPWVWDNSTGMDGSYIELSSNAVKSIFHNANALNYYTSWASGNDQFSALKLSGAIDTSNGSGLGVSVRWNTGGTAYFCVIDASGFIQFGKLVASVVTNITSRSVTYVGGTELALSVLGTNFRIWYGGVQQGADITDSSIASGKPGIVYIQDVDGSLGDDYRCGTS